MSHPDDYPTVEPEAFPPGKASRIRVPTGFVSTLANRARNSMPRRPGSPRALRALIPPAGSRRLLVPGLPRRRPPIQATRQRRPPIQAARWRGLLVPAALAVAMSLNVVLISAIPASSAVSAQPASGGHTRLHALARLVLSPAKTSEPTGTRVTYTAEGYDSAGHDLGDVTASTEFSITPDGSCTGPRCAAKDSGWHTVTGTIQHQNRTVRDTAALLAVPPPAKTSPGTVQPSPNTAGPRPGQQQPGDTGGGPGGGGIPQSHPAPATGRNAGRSAQGAHLVLSPGRTFIPSGGSVTYTAVAFDAAGHNLGDVTASTTFAIGFSGEKNSFLTRPDGSCTAAICTATKLGRHTVTGTFRLADRTITGDAAVQVVPRRHPLRPPPQLASLRLVPGSSVIESGGTRQYEADGYDRAGNFLGDFTDFTTFSISPDGSCTTNACTATKVGTHTVTGTIKVRNRQVTGFATLLVVPRLVGLKLTPPVAVVPVRGTATFIALGLITKHGPAVDLTDFASFTVTPPAVCTANMCMSKVQGRYTVTGSVDLGDRTVSGAALLVVVGPGDFEVNPKAKTITAGDSVTYRATVTSESGDVLNLTPFTRFTITKPGSCAKATCTSTKAGIYHVTGTVKIGSKVLSQTVELTVVPGPPVRLSLSPGRATIVADHDQRYSASAVDAFGNPLPDITDRTTFSIGPDGSCATNVCTATIRGRHSVTGTVQAKGGPVTGNAILNVVPGPLTTLIVWPVTATVKAGHGQLYHSKGSDAFGNSLGILTTRTNFSIKPDGSCTGNSCTADIPGPHTVTGIATARGGRAAASVTLNVVGGPRHPLTILELSPGSAVIHSGNSVSYTATATDAKHTRQQTVTHRTHFVIEKGSCSGHTCRPATLGWHVVKATVTVGTRVLRAKAHVLVVATSHIELRLNPRFARTHSHGHVTYTVGGVDGAHHVVIDLTTASKLSITPDGSCTGAVCTATRRGRHTVTATVIIQNHPVTATAILWISSGQIGPPGQATLVLDPRLATVDAGAPITFIAVEVAADGSLHNQTARTRFTITPDGSCSGATCTPAKAGKHIVTGTLTLTGPLTMTGPLARSKHRLIATATVQAKATLANCVLSEGDVQHPTVTPSRAAPGTTVNITATVNRKFAHCPVSTLLGDVQFPGNTSVGPDGGISEQRTLPSNIPPGTTSLKLAREDGGVVATIRLVVLAKPVSPAGNRWLWPAAAAALLLLLALAGAALSSQRARRQRRWVHQHVRATPHSSAGQVKADRDTDTAPTFAIRLRAHRGEGETNVQKEAD
jgi:hypothetical protein